MTHHDTAPAAVRVLQRIEQASLLDRGASLLRPVADELLADPTRANALRGLWSGHAVHPVATLVTAGLLTSGTTLDLVGDQNDAAAARRLIGLGLLSSLPSVLTGLAEWGATTGQGERRVGVLHAAVNSGAATAYAASWLARHRGRQRAGVRLGLVGAGLTGAAGFLGGHLTAVRKVSTRHPAFDETSATGS